MLTLTKNKGYEGRMLRRTTLLITTTKDSPWTTETTAISYREHFYKNICPAFNPGLTALLLIIVAKDCWFKMSVVILLPLFFFL
jgi:hypothetical protein